ncbi:metal-dependent phosphohydrolase [Anaeramoeba flamelloides]|uniref:Metal-dependent phosphohydrolase n=1 Tax=Anaeramoeba flamelloides TaxID=1746091 RepID=A0AAV7YN99_9EUKA|nr:metal-dependent phosphohydrolase [Anaeramoeba flamelloides]KAJ6234866.1 metal-dependent phosphohydrolase [Anaeramoeba flamelloides]
MREKVVTAWKIGCDQGGWKKVSDLTNMPFTLLTETKGINFVEHTIAVTEGAYGLAKAQLDTYKNKQPYPINLDVVVAGGLIHDVGKLVEYDFDENENYRQSRYGKILRHPFSGTLIAKEAGFNGDILNCIACHAKEGENRPQLMETILIHQADFSTFTPMKYLAAKKLVPFKN